MKKIISVLIGSSVCIIVLYLLFADMEEQMLSWLQSPTNMTTYAVLSFVFLLSDIVLPVPSSLVMILNGKVLGVFLGTVLSLVSGMASSVIGYYLGKGSGPLFNRFFSEQEVRAGNRFFVRYGKGAIALSKALPVLSESVSFLSGTTSISFRSFFVFSVCGHSVVSLVYAYAGSATNTYNSSIISGLIIGTTLVLAWLVQRVSLREKF